MERKLRKERVGIVTSNKMEKSITVLVERKVKHAMYGKFLKKSNKFFIFPKKTIHQDGIISTQINALATDNKGGVYIGTGGGLDYLTAEGKIEREIVDARTGLKTEMAGLITEATESILNQKLDAGADRKLVEQYLQEAMK